MRIAVLEDDFILLELLQAATERLGHVCHTFTTGTSLLTLLRRESFDLLIVDWHLPDMEGPEVVRAVRKLIGPQMPILFITRRQNEQDIVEALASGADDFMSKPIRMGEFTARFNALARRAYPHTDTGNDTPVLTFGRYVFDKAARTMALDSTPLDLTDREFELALFMFQNRGRLLSRDHLREMVWGQIYDVPSRTIDTHISRLRNKAQLEPDNGYTVSSVYGMGYRLEEMAPV